MCDGVLIAILQTFVILSNRLSDHGGFRTRMGMFEAKAPPFIIGVVIRIKIDNCNLPLGSLKLSLCVIWFPTMPVFYWAILIFPELNLLVVPIPLIQIFYFQRIYRFVSMFKPHATCTQPIWMAGATANIPDLGLRSRDELCSGIKYLLGLSDHIQLNFYI